MHASSQPHPATEGTTASPATQSLEAEQSIREYETVGVNRQGQLVSSLASLANGSPPSTISTSMAVDNGSNDKTRAVAHNLRAMWDTPPVPTADFVPPDPNNCPPRPFIYDPPETSPLLIPTELSTGELTKMRQRAIEGQVEVNHILYLFAQASHGPGMDKAAADAAINSLGEFPREGIHGMFTMLEKQLRSFEGVEMAMQKELVQRGAWKKICNREERMWFRAGLKAAGVDAEEEASSNDGSEADWPYPLSYERLRNTSESLLGPMIEQMSTARVNIFIDHLHEVCESERKKLDAMADSITAIAASSDGPSFPPHLLAYPDIVVAVKNIFARIKLAQRKFLRMEMPISWWSALFFSSDRFDKEVADTMDRVVGRIRQGLVSAGVDVMEVEGDSFASN
ncbi:hypothetical protein BJ508DRAFT_314161 [Ascobolus immersus RN42]|uniref:Uncharacterized protein n=1 Tax=Ascobolus immersus RN42 TaxID=1160509 RepID=A0A3N4HG23_ASCIM|nr:hypothetical protein BJ508DRAFT_314161 [Ascobolus immersus RN42]